MSSRRAYKRRRPNAHNFKQHESPSPENQSDHSPDEEEPADSNPNHEIGSEQLNERDIHQTEKEQQVWDAFREEYYEALEQLPLSLHRSFSLILELDQQVQTQNNQLLASLHAYIDTRNASFLPKQSTDIADPVTNNTPFNEIPSTPKDHSVRGSIPPPSTTTSTLSPITSTRTYLTTIAQLTESIVRASNEKVNLARFATDLVDRYIRDLDRSIKDQEMSISLGLRPGTHPAAMLLPPIVVPGRIGRQSNTGGQSPTRGDGDDMVVEVPMLAEGEGNETGSSGVGIVNSDGLMGENPTPKAHRKKVKKRFTMQRKKASGEKVVVAAVDQATQAELPEGEQFVVNEKEGPVGEGDKAEKGVRRLTLTVKPLNALQAVTQQQQQAEDDGEQKDSYCYCGGPSVGLMIACDDPECEKEWFHLGCVGLSEPPNTATWYCQDCAPKHPSPKKKRKR